MKFCIVGLGETGATITGLLIEKYTNCSIHILDPSDSISGRLLDLEHAASFKNVRISLNDFKNAEQSDVLFYCAGIRNDKNSDRTTEVKNNKFIIEAVFNQFKPNKECKIIVLTNPVESITKWISEELQYENTVVGTGTELDTYRLKYILAKFFNTKPIDININVLGEHGQLMLPIYSSAKVNENFLLTLIDTDKLKSFTEELKSAAKTIRLTEIATKYGVSQCAIFIMESFFSSKPNHHNVSTKVNSYYRGLLNTDEALFISLPCEISSKGIKIQNDKKLNDQEIKQLQEAAKKIMRVNQSANK